MTRTPLLAKGCVSYSATFPRHEEYIHFNTMKKFFINTAILTIPTAIAFVVFSSPATLSAQNEFSLDSNVTFRKATIVQVDFKQNIVVVELDDAKGFVIPVSMTATTTITLPNGDETLLPSLRAGASVYLFGSYDDTSLSFHAEKIVIRNRPITERSGLSRSQLERPTRTAEDVPSSLTTLTLLKIK